MNNIVEGLIYTNENCVGCNKCIGVCSCPGATIATETSDGRNVIKVDGLRCVACGACFDACEHHAREYIDDTADFFADLKKGENISVLFAPAFVASYPNEYKNILGKLKALGVNKILSVAFGADITTWGYLNYIHQNNHTGMISQPCPATVDYIEKYIPELIPKLMPVQSPVMCAAIYARKHMGLKDKLAFISPCIAKKSEIMSERGMGHISYNVTFDHLMKTLNKMDVEPISYEDEKEAGLGAVYPIPGGLADNIYWFLGEDAFVRSVEGEKRMYQFLENNKDRILDENSAYTMLDVLNCSDGCLCGTGVESNISSKEDVTLQMLRIKRNSKNKSKEGAWSSLLTPEERLSALNEQFKMLNLEDYMCSYTDRSSGCGWKEPTDEELDVIFENMNKSTPESRSINCCSCGYSNCREMAKAIYNGFNHRENCVHFLKDVLSGISADFPTVLLIHGRSHSIHVVKYAGEGAIRSWIDSGLSLIDYNTAIKDYIDRYVDEADRERVWENVEFSALLKHLSGTDRYEIMYFRHPESGKPGYFQLNFSRDSGSENIVLGFRDIDETVREEQAREKELEKALRDAEQANETKSTFLANMSHEIRTPINAILGMDTMILRESTQENVLEYARNVKSAGDTLLSLINDILDFSKIESGKLDIIEGKYRLDSVINDLMNMVRGKADEKGLELKLSMAGGIPSQLWGDEVRIKQVILNLLNNAVKYTKEGSVELLVGFEQAEEEAINLLISVKDTGIGIKKEDMHVLFSPYERIEENKNKLIEGTGLGLSITRNLLNKMGSDLQVDSIYGKGSEFSFKLFQKMWGTDRIGKMEISSANEMYAEEQRESFHAPDARVLVVDDVEMNITVLMGLLKRIQIKPDSCLSGKKAIEMAMESKYDIIFLDAMMPGMSGEETLHEIRNKCELNASTPIIVLTANAVIGAREAYIEEGFDDYMSKPIDGPKLEKMVSVYLPAEKMIEVSEDDVVEEEPLNISDSDKKLLEDLDKTENISTSEGIAATGDVVTYINICKNFYDTSFSRIEMIRDFYDKKDAPNYTIQVHALKSSARLVGAGELSANALKLEMAGREADWKTIEAETAALISLYEKVAGAIGEAISSEADSNKEELSEKKLKRRLSELLELVEAFDMESAKELFSGFEKYKLPDSSVATYRKLKALIADVDRDEIIKTLNEYLVS